MSSFGDMLRNRRAELRLGLRDFALRADLDAGNLSKIERGRLNAPQDRSVLDRVCLALEWDLGSAEAQHARDVAALENGRIPEDLLDDEALLAKLPVLLRTVHNRQLDPDEVEKLIEIMRKG
jgi:transcriptional regulator with XRE-family HTH domain